MIRNLTLYLAIIISAVFAIYASGCGTDGSAGAKKGSYIQIPDVDDNDTNGDANTTDNNDDNDNTIIDSTGISLEKISPGRGSTNTTIIITGEGFEKNDIKAVRLCNKNALNIKVVSDTKITCKVPYIGNNQVSCDVAVKSSSGNDSLEKAFLYLPDEILENDLCSKRPQLCDDPYGREPDY